MLKNRGVSLRVDYTSHRVVASLIDHRHDTVLDVFLDTQTKSYLINNLRDLNGFR